MNKEARPIAHDEHRRRYIMSGDDTLHHTVIVARKTHSGQTWTDESADRLTVYERLRRKEPVVRMEWGDGTRVVMVIFKGDCLEMERKDGKGRGLFVVRSVSRRDIKVRPVEDARRDDEVKKDGERHLFRIRSGKDLRKRQAVKVLVSPIGEVTCARLGQ